MFVWGCNVEFRIVNYVIMLNLFFFGFFVILFDEYKYLSKVKYFVGIIEFKLI